MTTVNWERMSGEDIEQFVAAALTKERGGGCQITPSSGDGGIDVLLPKEDGTWEVVQVKRYSRPLESKQKKNIRKSWERFLEQDLTAHKISAWTLAMPWNPTREALEWLQEFPPETEYAKTWMGRTKLDVLAAENPLLVDYYFGNGAARVEELLTRGMEAGQSTNGLVGIGLLEGARGRHEALAKALDEVDPFYAYEISVKRGQVPIEDKAYVAEANGAAMVQFATIDADRYTVMRVIPAHPMAEQLRPIRQTIHFEARPGTPEHRMLTDFAMYGVPFQGVVGNVVEALGPPGTARTGQSLFSFTALANEAFPPLELRGIDPQGEVVATLPLLPPETSSGFTRERFWLTAKDPSGLVTVEMRIGGTDKLWELKLRHGSLTGQPAVEASRVGEFYLAVEATHALSLAHVGGKELVAPFELNGALSEPTVWRWVDLYARLQRHTHDRVVLPDLGQLAQGDIVGLHNTVRALEGEEVEVPWHTSTVAVPTESVDELLPFAEAAEPFEVVEVFDYTMPLGGVTVELGGRLAARLLSCHLAFVGTGTKSVTNIVISPAQHNRALLTTVDDTVAVGRYIGTSGTEATENATETFAVSAALGDPSHESMSAGHRQSCVPGSRR